MAEIDRSSLESPTPGLVQRIRHAFSGNNLPSAIADPQTGGSLPEFLASQVAKVAAELGEAAWRIGNQLRDTRRDKMH